MCIRDRSKAPHALDLEGMLEEGLAIFATLLSEFPTASDEALWERLFQRLHAALAPVSDRADVQHAEVPLAS